MDGRELSCYGEWVRGDGSLSGDKERDMEHPLLDWVEMWATRPFLADGRTNYGCKITLYLVLTAVRIAGGRTLVRSFRSSCCLVLSR